MLRILAPFLVLVVGTLLALRLVRQRNFASLERRLSSGSAKGVFSEKLVSTLPDVGRRYLLHAIRTGTPLATWVRLTMKGEMRIAPDRPWLPMKAVEILSRDGFLWRPRVGRAGLRLSGADHYADGRGEVRFAFWGLVPVVNAHGPDVSRSAAGRFAGELIWLPSALLPGQDVTWEAVDPVTARLRVSVGAHRMALTLSLNEDGSPRAIAYPRWGDPTQSGGYDLVPFGALLDDPQAFGGYTIPTRVSAGWWFGTDRYFEFFRARIISAEFHG